MPCLHVIRPLLQTGSEGEDLPRHSSVHEAAVLVTHQALHEGDRGLIIAGHSLHLGDLLGQDTARACLSPGRAARKLCTCDTCTAS